MAMPRRPRLEAAGALHHVVAKAPDGSRIVADDADRLRFLDGLRAVAHECGWIVIAYCLMDTHVHLVVCTPEPNLGEGMKLLLGRYSSQYNRRLGRHGYVFSRPYWSRRIDKPHYLLCAALYAVLNAVAAGICGHPRDYRWCSYVETADANAATGIVAPAMLLRTFDDDPETARGVYRGIVNEAVERLGRRRSEEEWWRSVERAAAETLRRG